MKDFGPSFRTGLTLLCVFALTITSLSGGKAAEPTEVDLELVIAADVSDSMDGDELWLQRMGFAAAFRDREIINAITKGALGRVAVTYVEWADVGNPRVVVPWTLIDSVRTAEAISLTLETTSLTIKRKTSISDALLFAAHLLDNNAYQGYRRVIDVSGDGPNNQGRPVLQARAEVLARGIVINGLPIQLEHKDTRRSLGKMFGNAFDVSKLDVYYEDCVIGGPGAFIVSVKSLNGLVEAIRNKLYTEVAGTSPEAAPILVRAARQRPSRLAC